MVPRNRKQKIKGSDSDGESANPVAPAILTKAQMKWKQEYEENQKHLLSLYEQDEETLKGRSISETSDEREEDRLLAKLCLYLNIASLIGNLVASILSGSLSVLSTFVDSSMDIGCSLVMNVCLRMIQHNDPAYYPRGRERLELVGVIFCSTLMGFANISMVMQAANSIANGTVDPEMTWPTLAILGVQTILKAGLSWLCYRRNSTSSIVIAMDLRNDIVTRVLAMVCGFVGDRYWRLADPIGAIGVCALIAVSWFYHAMEHIPSLVGKSTARENLSRILKITLDHDPRIRFVDHVMVYHTGEHAQVELHIVMDESLPLKITHDISHPLEKKLQRLEFVERAFVHCDYDCDGD